MSDNTEYNLGFDDGLALGKAEADALRTEVERLRNAATDALAGWRYIRQHHGDLYGVGWDRVESALAAALSAANDMSEAEKIAAERCRRCVGFGTIAYFGDANVTCPDCNGTGRKRNTDNG